MIKIIPAILTSDPQEVKTKLSQAEGIVDRVQVDIIDGQFVDNKTIDPLALEGFETDLKIDFHLMVKEPIDWIEKCVRAGADRIIGQIEQMSDQVAFVGKAQETGLYIGLAVDIDTPISRLDQTILTSIDAVLVMAVKAGFGGQKFNVAALEKVKNLDEIRVRDDTPFSICVDGGETKDTIDKTRISGADEVVIGRKLFAGDLRKNIDRFFKAAYK